MGTKLRALFQRKKGRDLFDFWFILKNNEIDLFNVVKIFNYYLDKQGLKVSKKEFEDNLLEKANSPRFVDDIRSLLSPEIESQWNLEEGIAILQNRLFPCLSGDKGKTTFSSVQKLSLGEILTQKRGDELFQLTKEALAAGVDVNDTSLNKHRPLQLLIKASLDSRSKFELVSDFVERGADIHTPDNSGLTPYQVAISEGNKAISDLLRSKEARPMSPPGTGYAQHYNMYREIPIP